MKSTFARCAAWVIQSVINRKKFGLSGQISLTYGLILCGAMFLTGILTTGGVYYLFFHQAERALEISINELTSKMPRTFAVAEFPKIYIPRTVILRVTDENGNIVLDTAPNDISTNELLSRIRQNPPFWSNENYTLIETDRSFFYYKEIPLTIDGETFRFRLFTNITFERQNIRHLLTVLFAINLIGLLMAVMAGGIFIQRRLLNRIEENFKRQQQFILDASHEFKTPLTVIRGYSDMLKTFGAADPELVEEAAAAMQNSAKNLQALTENLLFLAHADQNNQPLEKVPLEINSLLRETIANFKNPRIEFVENEQIEIRGDYNLLKKMFAAIIENALIYSEGKVTVTLENSAVKISDGGIGIAAENLERIFDRFFRVDKSRTQIDGRILFGLGLPIAKCIADSHEIQIQVESKIGGGSTFALTFAR